MLIHMSVIYVDSYISHFGLSVCFWQKKRLVSSFGVLFDFLIFEKMDPRNFIKFCVKNEIKYGMTFKMLTFDKSTMSRTQVQLWYNPLREGWEYVSDDARPGRLITSTTDVNIKAVKKMILYNRRITIGEVTDDFGISFGSCQAIFMDVLDMQYSKIAKFWAKTTWHRLRSGDDDDIQRRSRFAQKAHNW